MPVPGRPTRRVRPDVILKAINDPLPAVTESPENEKTSPLIPMRERSFLNLLILLWVVLASADSRATIVPSYQLGAFKDPGGSLGITEVAEMDPVQFKPLPYGALSAGFTHDTFWFRLTVDAPKGEWWLDILPPVLDDLRLYEPDRTNPGSWLERRSGDMLPFSSRELPYRSFVFKLQHDNPGPRTYYMRLQTISASMLTTRLLSPPDFMATTTLEAGLMLATIAVVLIVAMLNLNNWLWLRDALSPWFIAQLLCLAGYFSTSGGFVAQYLLTDSPRLNFGVNTAFAFLLISTGNGMFRRLFSLDRQQQPILFWLFELSCWLPVIALPLALLGWQVEILPVFLLHSIFTNLVCCFVSVGLWRRGTTGSTALLLANLLTFAGIFISIAQVMGLIPGGVYVWQSMQFSSLASILAIHVSLGAHYRDLSRARQQAELQAKWEHDERVRQQEFLGMLTHELRNSLAVLRMSVGVQPMSSKSMVKAERAMISMGQVIDHAIEAARLADGKLVIEHAPCDFSSLVRDVIDCSLKPDLFKARLNPGIALETDAHLLRIIVTNLVDNALKYGKANTPIELSLGTSGAQTCLRISNQIGSAGAPDPDQVFEKYYRAPKAFQITGSGLGLYITKELARLLGGEVLYRPTSNRVSFEVYL